MSEKHAGPTFEQLAEEFAERFRQGERPKPQEYADRYPKFADQIHDLFPAMVMMEEIAPDSDDSIDTLADAKCRSKQQHPTQIGDFRIVRQAGRGGMGVVYEAEQVSLGRHVALKVLPQLADTKQKRRFEREAKAAAKLHHTNIVPVFGVGEENGISYYVMQFIQGLGLDEVLDELRQLQNADGSAAATPRELKVSRVTPRSDVNRTTYKTTAPELSAAEVARSLLTGQFENELSVQDDQREVEQDVGQAALQQVTATATLESMTPTSRGDSSVSNSSGSFSLSSSTLSSPGSGEIIPSKRRPQTYWQSVAHIGRQVAEALQYAHDQGVLHRDVKPGNLLLDMRGTVWVTDFGLAKANDQQDITHTGDIFGTLRYMPPEAFETKTEAQGDIYSLGLTLYELLALQPAFRDRDRQQLVKHITTGELTPLNKLNPAVPRDLVTIIHRAVERNSRDRYQSAGQLAEDLQRFLDDEPIKARRITLTERFIRWSRRNKGLASSLAALVGLLIAIAVGSVLMAGYYQKLADRNAALADRNASLVDEKSEALQKEEVALSASLAAQREARLNLYQASLFATQQALANSQSSIRAKGLLSQLRPKRGETDLRGWEWFYLNSLARQDESLVIPLRGTKFCATFDPSGEKVATGGPQEIAVFDAKTGKELFSRLHTDAFRSISFSPNGKWLAAGGDSNIVRIWDTQDWTEVHRFIGHTRRIFSVAWSPDSQRVASAGSDRTIKVWDVAQNAHDPTPPDSQSDRSAFTLSGHSDSIYSIAWHKDGTRIASAGRDKTIRIWDAQAEKLIRVLDAHNIESGEVAWNSDGTQIGVCGASRICILDVVSGETLKTFRLPWNSVWIAWSPDDKYLAVAEYGGNSARILCATTGETILNIRSPTGGFYDCGLSHNATRLVTNGANELRIWNTKIDDPQDQAGWQIGIADQPVQRFRYDASGNHIAAIDGSQEGAVKIWDVRSKTNPFTLDGHDGRVSDLAWKPDASMLATGGQDGAIVLWDPANGRTLATLPGHGDSRVKSLAWHSQGTRLASAGGDQMVRIWDVSSQRQLRALKLQAVPSAVAWHPTEPWVAAAAGDTIHLWDTNSGKQLASYSNPGLVLRSICFNRQGNLMAAAGARADDQAVLLGSLHRFANIRLWDLEKGVQQRGLRGHEEPVNSICWNRAGDRIISASDDGTVKIWNANIGQELLSFRTESPVTFACFDPSELRIVAATSSERIVNWDATPGYEIESSERVLPELANRIHSSRRAEDLIKRARILARAGRWEEAAEDFEQAGAFAGHDMEAATWFLTNWRGIGPYPAPAKELPVEVALTGRHSYSDREGFVTWDAIELDRGEYLDFSHYLKSTDGSTGFVVMRIYSMSDQSVGCVFGGTGVLQLFCNDKLIHTRQQPRPVQRYDQAVNLQIQSGWNTIAVQASNDEGHHGLFVKLTSNDRELAKAFERTKQWQLALNHWSRVVEGDRYESTLLALGRIALHASQGRLAEEAFSAAIDETQERTTDTRKKIAGIYAKHGLEILKTPARTGESQPIRERSALASLATARRIYEQIIEETADASVAMKLSNTLYYPTHSSGWEFLDIIEAKSAGGARLRRLDDGSILADGINPERDQYTIVSETSVDNIVALCLEPVRDRSMVGGNPGRCTGAGDFRLSEFQLFVAEPNGRFREITFRKALRDGKLEGEKAIDGDSETGFLEFGHVVFVPQQPIKIPGHLQLKTVMKFGGNHHSLGRFRLAVTSDPQLITAYENRVKMAEQENEWVRLGMSYALIGETNSAAMAFARALDDADDEESVTEITSQVKKYAGVLEELRKLRPDHSTLRALP